MAQTPGTIGVRPVNLVEDSVGLYPATPSIGIGTVRAQGDRSRCRGKDRQVTGPQAPRPIGEPYRLQRRDERAAHEGDAGHRRGGTRQYLGNAQHVLQRLVLMASRPVLHTLENLREGLGHQLPKQQATHHRNEQAREIEHIKAGGLPRLMPFTRRGFIGVGSRHQQQATILLHPVCLLRSQRLENVMLWHAAIELQVRLVIRQAGLQLVHEPGTLIQADQLAERLAIGFMTQLGHQRAVDRGMAVEVSQRLYRVAGQVEHAALRLPMRVSKLNPHTIRHWATEGFEQARMAREADGSPICGFIHQGMQCLLDRFGDLAFQSGNLHGQAQPGALVFTQDALSRGIECPVQLLLIQAPGIEFAASLDQFIGASGKYPFLPRRDQPGSQVEIVAGGKVAHQAEQAVFTPLPVRRKWRLSAERGRETMGNLQPLQLPERYVARQRLAQ